MTSRSRTTSQSRQSSLFTSLILLADTRRSDFARHNALSLRGESNGGHLGEHLSLLAHGAGPLFSLIRYQHVLGWGIRGGSLNLTSLYISQARCFSDDARTQQWKEDLGGEISKGSPLSWPGHLISVTSLRSELSSMLSRSSTS